MLIDLASVSLSVYIDRDKDGESETILSGAAMQIFHFNLVDFNGVSFFFFFFSR